VAVVVVVWFGAALLVIIGDTFECVTFLLECRKYQPVLFPHLSYFDLFLCLSSSVGFQQNPLHLLILQQQQQQQESAVKFFCSVPSIVQSTKVWDQEGEEEATELVT
jgi:hypothetical protein